MDKLVQAHNDLLAALDAASRLREDGIAHGTAEHRRAHRSDPELSVHVEGLEPTKGGRSDEAPRPRRRGPRRRARRLRSLLVPRSMSRGSGRGRPLGEQPPDARGPAARDGRGVQRRRTTRPPTAVRSRSCSSSATRPIRPRTWCERCGRPTRRTRVPRMSRASPPGTRPSSRPSRTTGSSTSTTGAGRDVVDLDAESIAETWLGIVTYEGMAECLGWPDERGRLRRGHRGARGRVGVRTPAATTGEWGDPRSSAFTNPNTSTSGRNVLISLYTMFADRDLAG